ncbi:hypothetical protein BYI23_C012910 [Burkholderia sp. YI23]|nr:hypothetical protein BYI23_C012910 [Burkholderia sp. YI23]
MLTSFTMPREQAMKYADHEYQAQSLATCAPEALGSILAEVLGARRCIVHAPADPEAAGLSTAPVAVFGEIHPSPDRAIVEHSDARDRMFSVLPLHDGKIVIVQVFEPQRKSRFTDLDLQLLRIMSGFIATTIGAQGRTHVRSMPETSRACQPDGAGVRPVRRRNSGRHPSADGPRNPGRTCIRTNR